MVGLTKLALRRPVSVMIIVLALAVFGFSTILTTPLELIPDIETPMFIIYSVYAGASPEDIENSVTSVIEDAVSTIPGVKHVQSTSSENMSMVFLEMEYGTNMDEANSNIKNNLDTYQSSLPADASDPTVVEISVNMMATVTLSATATGDVDLRYYVEDEVVPQLEQLSGVASVEVSGGQSDYISVSLIPERLNQYGLSASDVVSLISVADFTLPADTISQGNLDMALRGGVSYSTAQQLEAMPITLATGDIISLSDIANVTQRAEAADSISRTNGNDTVSISVSKRQSASTVSVARAVAAAVDEINAQNIGVELSVVYDSSDMIEQAIESVMTTLFYGVILAMAVIFIFFGEWRASLIVGSSIPVSMLLTVSVMGLMGYSFNMMSLGGLVIGSGMIVDNSIVVLESCFRQKGLGRSFYDTAVDGAGTVASSILASTITTVVVFLPIAFISGMSGQLFGQLCFTIIFCLIASLIAAVTLVPLVYYKVQPAEKTNTITNRVMAKLEGWYRSFLPSTLRHRKLVALIAVVLFVISVAMVPFIGVELLPETDDGIITVSVDARPGTNLQTLEQMAARYEQMVSEHPDVDRYSLSIGGSGATVSLLGSGSGDISITAYLRDGRDMSTDEIVSQWREATRGDLDCDVNVASSSTTAMMVGGSDITVTLQSTDFDALREASPIVEDMLAQNAYVESVSSTISNGDPQAEIVIDPALAAAHYLTPIGIMSEVRNVMVGQEAATISQGGREYSVMVEYPEGLYETVSDLSSLNVTNALGASVPLFDVATIEYSQSPQSISRMDGMYLLEVTAQPRQNAPDNLSDQITDAVRALELPDGVEVTQSTQDSEMQEEFSALYGAIATAIFLVFVVMAMQFESPRFSLVVMMCIPFSLIGSMGLLLLFGSSISMVSLMGFLMLVGIVVNNGILFIDTANMLRNEKNLPAEQALTNAGAMRMRPIFMTSLTTIIAMVPMTADSGSNGELMRGMALVIIGGMIAATILTLILLPSFYMLADNVGRKKVKKFKSMFSKKKPAKQNS